MKAFTPKLAKGFTLIELLIVVAIIAILAAIAVPNFLEAQVRSKVSRVKADMRTMRTAVEAYAVDYNRPPRMSWGGTFISGYHPAGSSGDTYEGVGIYGTLTYQITTPISYLSSFDFKDPFVSSRVGSVSADARLYTYQDMKDHDILRTLSAPNGSGARARANSINDNKVAKQDFGAYFLLSIGPKGNDTLYWPAIPATASVDGFWTQYDPTNGTASSGTIYVSQKYGDIVQRPY